MKTLVFLIACSLALAHIMAESMDESSPGMPCTSDRVAGGYGRYGGYGKGYRGGYGRYHDENQDTEKDAGSPYYGRHGERSSTGRENRAYGYRAYGRYPDENQDAEKDVISQFFGRHGERSSTGRENRYYYGGYGYRSPYGGYSRPYRGYGH